MPYENEIVEIDDEYIELMIERCFAVDQYLIVRNLGNCYAELRYRKYTYRNTIRTYSSKDYKLIDLKRIFTGLINKYLSFEHEGYRYYRHHGEWTRIKNISK